MPTRVLRDQLGEKLAQGRGRGFFRTDRASAKHRAAEPAAPTPPRSEAQAASEAAGATRKAATKRARAREEKKSSAARSRGEGRRDTYDARDEIPHPAAARRALPRKRGRDKPRGR